MIHMSDLSRSVVTVGIADMKLLTSAGTLITHALGSCLGITAFDPIVRVGALLHLMLPSSMVAQHRAANNPYMFADTGIPLLFRECYAKGAARTRMVVTITGGASLRAKGNADFFRIGKRNIEEAERLLAATGVAVAARDLGGTCSRTVSLDVRTGDVFLRIGNETRCLK